MEWLFRRVSAGDHPAIQNRLFTGLSLLGGVLTLFVVLPVNMFQGLPRIANVAALAFGSFALVAFWLARRGRYLVWSIGLSFLAMLDTIWIANAGSQGPMDMFFFVAAMYVVVFFNGRSRWAMFGVLLANGIALHLLEQRYPGWVVPYPDPSTRLMDFLFAFVIAIVTCVLVLWVVLTNYQEERVRLEQANETIRDSEERYRGLFENSQAVMLLIDPNDYTITDANPAAARFYGWERQELVGMSIHEINLLAPAELRSIVERIRRERPNRFEFQHRLADGSVREVEVFSSPISMDGHPRLFSIIHDITERKEIEGELHQRDADLLERERELRGILENMQDAYLRTDANGRFLQASPSAPRIFGYDSVEELLGLSAASLYHDLKGRQNLLEALRIQGHVYDWIEKGLRKDGTVFWMSMNVQPVRDAEGRIVGTEGIIRDVSQRKEAEALAQRHLLRQQAILDNLPMMAWLKDSESRLEMVNAAYAKACGYTVEECLGKTDLDLFPRELAEGYIADDRQVCLSRQKKQLEERISTPEGTMWAYTCKTPLMDEVGVVVGTTGVALDITERKRMEDENHTLEAQFHHLLRMESVGRLAGGVAHDMNNVLSAIMAVAAIIQHKGGPEARHAETILKASERGRNLVKGLLEFARKEVPEADLLDLNDLVRREAELLSGTTLSRIRVELDLAPELPMIMGSATALSTALMNLCVNAVDAMPENGTLRLHTSFRENTGVELLVEDTGQGMPPDVLARAMEPFFTTKPVGKGTGLGLSMVFGTVQSHGGNLDIESEVGHGTRIRIRLPIVSDHRLRLTAGPVAPAFSNPQAYKILLVDDDPLIRETSLALLEFLGHQVTAVRGGQEALDLIQRSSGWDVMVLDLNMPGLDGIGTLRRLRDLQPTLPVIMATGYADEDTRRELASLRRVVLLLKPYSLQEIQGVLVGVLG